LYAKQISHGYWVRSVDVETQIDEILQRFDLYDLIKPFSRCLVCNGVLTSVSKADILDYLEPKTRLYYEDFYQCADCRRIYWEGSHMENMRKCYPGFPVLRNSLSSKGR